MSERYVTIDDVIHSDEHVELVGNQVVIENKTTIAHNTTVSDIAGTIRNYIASKNGTCRVFTENVALYVNELLHDESNFFLPDVMVVCGSDGISEDGIHTVPLFVAEVTSESTKKYDYCEKLETYRKIGIEEYWIVDIQKNIVYKYLKSEDFIPQVFLYSNVIPVSVYPGLQITISAIT